MSFTGKFRVAEFFGRGDICMYLHFERSLVCICSFVYCFLVPIRYNLASGYGFKIGDRISILEPMCKHVRLDASLLRKYAVQAAGGDVSSVSSSIEEFSFLLARVDQPLTLLVNGKQLDPKAHANITIQLNSIPD